MKNISLKLFLVAFLISSSLFAQSKVKERQVLGKWKLHLNLKEKVKEETKDESGFGKLLARGIVSAVDDLIQEADITFNFKRNNVLEVTQKDIMDKSEEKTETYKWKIDKKGRLVTTQSKNKRLKFNDNSGWMIKKGKLVPVDDDKKIEDNVWLQKVK